MFVLSPMLKHAAHCAICAFVSRYLLLSQHSPKKIYKHLSPHPQNTLFPTWIGLFELNEQASLCQTSYNWTQNICKPGLRHSRRRREDGKSKGGARRVMRYRLPSLPVPRLSGTNMCICNGQRSSEISCDKYTIVPRMSTKYEANKNRLNRTAGGKSKDVPLLN
jgi:hypothetical protein